MNAESDATGMSTAETDWPNLVPEPRWDSLDAPAETIQALGVGPSAVRARAYYMLGESLLRRTAPEERDAAVWSYVMAHTLRPEAAAYVNLGFVLRQSGRLQAARSAFAKAVFHTPKVAAAHSNLAALPGTPPAEAAALLRTALSLAPNDGGGYAALAGQLKRSGDVAGARAAHEQSLRLAPTSGTAFGDWRSWWPAFYERRGQLRQAEPPADGIQYQAILQFPFSHVELRAIAEAHARAAATALEAWREAAGRAPPLPTFLGAGKRLRVAYIGALSDEPQLNAMSPVFSSASATAAYTFYALTPPPPDEPHYYRHLKASMAGGALRHVHTASPQQLAAAIRGEGAQGDEGAQGEERGAHLLLDGSWLKECTPPHEGGSSLTRLNCALHHRPAPVRLSVLAAPVTNGLPGYTLADAVAVRVPQGARGFSERLVLLSHGSYPFSHAAWAPPLSPALRSEHSRSAEGLGRHSPVAASFVQRWKLNPLSWGAWCNMLRRAPRASLWVLQHSSDGESYLLSQLLRGELAARGLRAGRRAPRDAGRLVVMRRRPLEEHVARTGLADLVLDTTPYSAHTTAADAFWLDGPPWLALTGERFDSRLSSSVLQHTGLGSLRTASMRAFEDMGAALLRS